MCLGASLPLPGRAWCCVQPCAQCPAQGTANAWWLPMTGQRGQGHRTHSGRAGAPARLQVAQSSSPSWGPGEEGTHPQWPPRAGWPGSATLTPVPPTEPRPTQPLGGSRCHPAQESAPLRADAQEPSKAQEGAGHACLSPRGPRHGTSPAGSAVKCRLGARGCHLSCEGRPLRRPSRGGPSA